MRKMLILALLLIMHIHRYRKKKINEENKKKFQKILEIYLSSSGYVHVCKSFHTFVIIFSNDTMQLFILVTKLKSKICIINCIMEWFASKNNKISDKNK